MNRSAGARERERLYRHANGVGGTDKPRQATVAQATAMAKQWTPQELECRVNGHDFQPYRVRVYPRHRLIKEVRVCACGVQRHRWITEKSGRIEKSWLQYPKPEDGKHGYLSEHGRVVGEAKDVIRLKVVLANNPVTVIGKSADDEYNSERRRVEAGGRR